jgi:phosphoribosyl 1,2-cyclic phosphodiesterase
MQLTFWGVRGSFPTPRRETCRYGGNTPCITVQAGGEGPLIIDAGTGALALGEAWFRRFGDADADLLFTHFHWDHIQGLPGFKPLYRPGATFRLHTAAAPEQLQAAVAGQMSPPYFPVYWRDVPAAVSYAHIATSGSRIGAVRVSPIALHHPGGCFGYRLEAPDGVVVVATDHECGTRDCDDKIVESSRGADILVLDAQYTPEEYASRRGWGHSSWVHAVTLAKEAEARQVVLFHHDPARTDDELDAIARMAALEFPNTIAAREGVSITVEAAGS